MNVDYSANFEVFNSPRWAARYFKVNGVVKRMFHWGSEQHEMMAFCEQVRAAGGTVWDRDTKKFWVEPKSSK